MQTLKEVLEKGKVFLAKHGVLHPKRSMEDFLAFQMDCTRCALYMQLDKPLEEKELSLIRCGVKRLAHHEPLEYITQNQAFYGLSLEINSSVLVPRPETEIFVDRIVKKISSCDLTNKVLWDIGTGSGAIALALKKSFTQLCVKASDLSLEALFLAEKNAKKNHLDVSFFSGDLFEPFSKNAKIDFLVSNPPYLSSEEYSNAHPILYQEPKMALVGGKTGLEFYERLEKQSKPFLAKKAQIFFEIGSNQADALLKIFSDSFWKRKEIFLDWAQHPRFFFVEIE